jgi:hypothetical protein
MQKQMGTVSLPSRRNTTLSFPSLPSQRIPNHSPPPPISHHFSTDLQAREDSRRDGRGRPAALERPTSKSLGGGHPRSPPQFLSVATEPTLRARQGRARQGRISQTRQDKTIQDKTRHGKTRHGKRGRATQGTMLACTLLPHPTPTVSSKYCTILYPSCPPVYPYNLCQDQPVARDPPPYLHPSERQTARLAFIQSSSYITRPASDIPTYPDLHIRNINTYIHTYISFLYIR